MARDDSKTDRELLEELADRARRTETRVTKVANHLGVDAGGDKPEFNADVGVLQVPSRKTSLDDVLGELKHYDVRQSIRVYCGDDYLFAVALP